MKKKFFKAIFVGAFALLAVTNVSAQEKKENIFGLGNRVGVGVGVGTEGIGIDVAVPLTKYVQVRAGLNIFPNIKFHEETDVEYTGDVSGNIGGTDFSGPVDIQDQVRLDAKFGRTYGDLKFDCYPFGNSSSFFVTAGFSFGGGNLVKITGHSNEMQALHQEAKNYGVNIGDYEIPFDENGDIKGGVKVNNFRPYLGLGFGRLIPKKRVGFRFEIGAQFQGKPKVYYYDADGKKQVKDVVEMVGDNISNEDKDDITKVMDWLRVYPVLKFSLRGRIL